MKVYILPAWYPQNSDDVVASFFREQAHALASRGHDVTVIHIEPLSIKKVFKQKRIIRNVWIDGDVRTIFYKVLIPIPAIFTKVQEDYISRLYCKLLKDEISNDIKNGKSKPDVLHAHVSHSCAYYYLFAAKALNLPLVVTEHYSGLLLGTASKREYYRVRKTIQNANEFIFVGSNFKKTICEKLNINKETNVIPNLIDTDLYHLGKKDKDCFVFLSACHLRKNKSISLIVDAFHKAFCNINNVKLIIAGDGEEYCNIQNQINELGENSRIIMKGRYNRDESIQLFSCSNAFILTSKVETFGIVYIEALACGIPCIGTRGQGAEDIITSNNGFLVDYGNCEELMEKMLFLYKNRDFYNGNRIRQDCIDRFSIDVICTKIEKIYKKVITDR